MKKTFEVAIENDAKVKMIYLKGSEVIERIIKPYKVTDDLVWCFDYFRKQKRTYRLENVLGAQIIRTKED
ncbi:MULTISPECIES: hypothetical protein [unclassified Fusibacter]|uniref:hypothetical protein n=1 Tax=unclassified Fusibacter TaxID=2624464 RepID=UPI0010114090|nr:MULTISPECIES: hypothetical protein [unclassified Fusibacter]MCK8061707.1 hypothetical protein [Fusibacter sp. A2]NPE23883.1 hypothetical protein [Fusibacter sp. A1]RXV58507.1 hypothetical protein DWB64_19035 [Fusibacter sp. A1]